MRAKHSQDAPLTEEVRNKFIDEHHASFAKARTLAYRIELRVPEHVSPDLVLACRTLSGPIFHGTDADTERLVRGIIDAAAPLLKNEWERVKLGEPAYIKAKEYSVRVIQGVAALAFVSGLWWLIGLLLSTAEIK